MSDQPWRAVPLPEPHGWPDDRLWLERIEARFLPATCEWQHRSGPTLATVAEVAWKDYLAMVAMERRATMDVREPTPDRPTPCTDDRSRDERERDLAGWLWRQFTR